MEQIIDYFLNNGGVFGIIIVALILVVVWQEREKKSLRIENKELARELTVLAEKRVADLERIKDADFALLEKIRDVEAEKSDRLKEMLGSVLSIAQNLQNLFNMKGKDV